jgi:GTPase SAR1 family protein
MLVYDITEKRSFENLGYWVTMIKKYSDKNTEIIIVGNKVDLGKKVATEEVKKFSSFYEWPHVETSAITGQDMEYSFQILIRNILKRNIFVTEENSSYEENVQTNVVIDEKKTKEKMKTNICCQIV